MEVILLILWPQNEEKIQERLASLEQPNIDFLNGSIQEFKASVERKDMLTAQEYYRNDTEIMKRVRYYLDRYGSKKELDILANNRISYPYLRMLVNQKVNYLLSKPITFKTEIEGFSELLGEKFGRPFMRKLRKVGTHAILNGLSWMQVYYSEQGELEFKRIPSEQVIAFWGDDDKTQLDGVIRYYTYRQYKPNGDKEDLKRVEYFTPQGAWYYVETEHGLEEDKSRESFQGHFLVNNADGETFVAAWGKVPFIPFKYTPDHLPLLKSVKSLIDAYNKILSEVSNNIEDIPDSIKVVKNYDGTDKQEFVQNLNTFRTAFVSGDGDMSAIETRLDSVTIDDQLNRLRKAVYEAGNGVDTQEAAIGNTSAIALKFRYGGLDTDTDTMAGEFEASIEELVWYITQDLANKGIANYVDTPYSIIFDTDFIINEQEIIDSCTKSVGIISDQTIVANHPWVVDPQRELELVKEERESKLELYPFGNDYGTNPFESEEEDNEEE